MTETFRLRIVSKRQVTIPQRMLNLLRLNEGDELQIDVTDNQIKAATALKAVPTELFTSEVLDKLNERESQIRKGQGVKVEVSDLHRDVEVGV